MSIEFPSHGDAVGLWPGQRRLIAHIDDLSPLTWVFGSLGLYLHLPVETSALPYFVLSANREFGSNQAGDYDIVPAQLARFPSCGLMRLVMRARHDRRAHCRREVSHTTNLSPARVLKTLTSAAAFRVQK